MNFEWDENKNQQNIIKHGVSFELAQQVFLDPFHVALLDKRFSYFEERWITLGATQNRKILVVANLFMTDDGEELIRIISAREANNKELAIYENH
ncbi:BrnT family toxin [Thiomicrospira sp. R3]|uniref:BrnT family toxin n=1 Tax=Thiomicrospira sp. R3 TaxID=3035472 RepID=UPI00259B2074|nr:BrnT family toxin [Thiomicrospira sp. R3]WFE68747.1 BrnT family toxin [Thiomicrospira sp. R3]